MSKNKLISGLIVLGLITSMGAQASGSGSPTCWHPSVGFKNDNGLIKASICKVDAKTLQPTCEVVGMFKSKMKAKKAAKDAAEGKNTPTQAECFDWSIPDFG
jgi:hypothetical protein